MTVIHTHEGFFFPPNAATLNLSWLFEEGAYLIYSFPFKVIFELLSGINSHFLPEHCLLIFK